jgi:hypothetical protein
MVVRRLHKSAQLPALTVATARDALRSPANAGGRFSAVRSWRISLARQTPPNQARRHAGGVQPVGPRPARRALRLPRKVRVARLDDERARDASARSQIGQKKSGIDSNLGAERDLARAERELTCALWFAEPKTGTFAERLFGGHAT